MFNVKDNAGLVLAVVIVTVMVLAIICKMIIT